MGKSLPQSGNWKELLDYLSFSGLAIGRGLQHEQALSWQRVGSPEHPSFSFEGVVETSEHFNPECATAIFTVSFPLSWAWAEWLWMYLPCVRLLCITLKSNRSKSEWCACLNTALTWFKPLCTIHKPLGISSSFKIPAYLFTRASLEHELLRPYFVHLKDVYLQKTQH